MPIYNSRAEIPDQYKWDLTPMYPDEVAWEENFGKIPALFEKLSAFDGRLAEGPEVVREALLAHEQAGRVVDKLWQYAARHRDEDMGSSHYNALVDRANGLYSRLEEVAAFLRPQLLSSLIEPGDLPEYAHYLDEIRRDRAHTLSPPEEAILAQVGPVADVPRVAHSMLTDADLTFEPILDEAGQEVRLSVSGYQRYVRSQDQRVRRDAYTSFFSEYRKHRNTLAATYAGHVKKNVFLARARHHASALEASLHPANVPVEVYTNLISAVRAGLPLLHRYYEVHRKALGLDSLNIYDLNVIPQATYPGSAQIAPRTIEYPEAVEMVLAALQPLGSDYVQTARNVFSSRWVDVYETPGKRGGAHSAGCYDSPPYIMLNYLNTLLGVSTLGHELGHTMHTLYTNSTQPYHYAYYNDFVSETASTLNECLLAYHLLTNSDDPGLRFTVVNLQLYAMRYALFRQTMLAEFELIAHKAYEQGQALTADWLSETYYNLNREYMGEGIMLDDLVGIEWTYLPHLYIGSGFMVYQYATGMVAATALAHGIVTEGEVAAQRYRRFLSGGNSAYALDLLRTGGVDMATPGPVEDTLGVFASRLDDLEALLA